MEIIHGPQAEAYQLDPDSRAFSIIDADHMCYVVFARTDVAAKMDLNIALEEEGKKPVQIIVCSEISSLEHWPYIAMLRTDGPNAIKTIIVRPIRDETEVYVLDRLPDALVELLSVPLPAPERRGVWPHGMTVGERQTCG